MISGYCHISPNSSQLPKPWRASFIFSSTMESKDCCVLPGLISRRRKMAMRRPKGVGFILWKGSILELGGKIRTKLRSPSPSVAEKEGRREHGEMSRWSLDFSK